MALHKWLLQLVLILLILPNTHGQSEITIDDIWTKGTFSTVSVPGFRFMKDGLSYSKKVGNTITKNDFQSGRETEIIFDASQVSDDGFSGQFSAYQFSQDERKILVSVDVESIYRRSSKGNFYVLDRSTKALSRVFSEGKILHASFSPDGSKVAFVFENNLYYKDLQTSKITKVTNDGKWNEIINGNCDWVYEEEFGFTKAFEWSGDSQKIGFYRFDESSVPEFTMTNYRDGAYPEYVTFKYPKVGETNSIVSIHIYHVIDGKTIKVDQDSNPDGYIPRIKWTNNPNELSILKLNRLQNHLDLLVANASDGTTRVLLSEDNKYYIDIDDDLTFLKSGEGFIWTSEKEGWNQVYMYDNNGKLIRKLTTGDYDVTNFYGVDETKRKIFFQAAEKSPTERQVYSIDFRGKKKINLTDRMGWNSAQFSSTYKFFMWTHSTANTPPNYRAFTIKGKNIRDLEMNTPIVSKMKAFGTQPVEFFSFLNSNSNQLNGYMIKPQDFDADKEYPVFMFLYGGPNSQQAIDRWRGSNYWWFQMLADNGYLVACVDNRGTGARGEEFRKMTYQQLGHYETLDQIDAAKYLGSLGYTDASRIGIFGWSYGGYMSSLCLLKGNDVFKSAIAVAPVTNWKWYDSIYTERYMRNSEENAKGYAENSPVYFADRLKGNYLLVHGLGDDNVHFQNSAEMAAALIAANKQFDTYFYPNRNHGIYGDNARRHLYTKMTDFLLEKL